MPINRVCFARAAVCRRHGADSVGNSGQREEVQSPWGCAAPSPRQPAMRRHAAFVAALLASVALGALGGVSAGFTDECGAKASCQESAGSGQNQSS